MPKTPDEIKKGLEDGAECSCCDGGCKTCADALALIQQLQAENAQQARCIENMTDKLNAMNDEVAKSQAELDAVMTFLRSIGCDTCRYREVESWEEPCLYCIDHARWQWLGVQKEE